MEEEEKKSFTVVDKRRFSEDGERRDAGAADEAASEARVEKAGASAPSAESKGAESSRPEEAAPHEAAGAGPEQLDDDPEIKVDFPSFIVSLYTQTMIMLGEIPHPETNLINTNLDAARQTIEVIAMLEERTEGNRSPEEDKLMKDVLSSLRMGYVKKAKG